MQATPLLAEPLHTARSPQNSAWLAVPPIFMFFTAYFAQYIMLARVLLRKTCDDVA